MCAPKLLPKYVAKLQLECLPHCVTQSHLLHGADLYVLRATMRF